MRRRDYRLERLVRDRRHAEGDPLREYERRAYVIRREASSVKELEQKLAQLREELGVVE